MAEARDESTVILCRAVGLNEAEDIRVHGVVRPHPAGLSLEGKWFATSFADAVAAVRCPVRVLADFFYRPRLDGIGPAYLVRRDQLSNVNALGVVDIDERVSGVEGG